MKRNITAGIFFLFIILGFFVVGCSHNVVVAPKSPEMAAANKMPIDLGLYLSEDFKNYEISESRKGDKWNFTNLGQASAAQFQLGLTQIFRKVIVVSSRPPLSSAEGPVGLVIEPQIDRFDFEIPMTKFQVYPAKINYRVVAYDSDGRILFTELAEGVGDTQGSPGFDFAENPSKAATKAVEEGVRNALEALVAAEELKSLQQR